MEGYSLMKSQTLLLSTLYQPASPMHHLPRTPAKLPIGAQMRKAFLDEAVIADLQRIRTVRHDRPSHPFHAISFIHSKTTSPPTNLTQLLHLENRHIR